MKATRGNVVRMHYILTDEGGEVLDRSGPGGPLEYLHGYGAIVPGLERALEGVESGHKATVRVAPEDAYGPYDPGAVFEVPREAFPEGVDLRPGLEVESDTPDGPLTFVVSKLTPGGAILDANHPLAGKTLQFDVEIVDVRDATPEEIAHGHVHGPHGH